MTSYKIMTALLSKLRSNLCAIPFPVPEATQSFTASKVSLKIQLQTCDTQILKSERRCDLQNASNSQKYLELYVEGLKPTWSTSNACNP